MTPRRVIERINMPDSHKRKYEVFHCPKDNCWLVIVWRKDKYIGVAECPDDPLCQHG